mgnify:CR=1 FL=1
MTNRLIFLILCIVNFNLPILGQSVINYDEGSALIRVANLSKTSTLDGSVVREQPTRDILKLYQKFLIDFDEASFKSGKNRNSMVYYSIPRIKTDDGKTNTRMLLVDRKIKINQDNKKEIYLLFAVILERGKGIAPVHLLHKWEHGEDGYFGTVIYD